MHHYKHSFFVEPQVEKLKSRVHAVLSQLECLTGAEIKDQNPGSLLAQSLEDKDRYSWIDGYELETAIDDLMGTLKKIEIFSKKHLTFGSKASARHNRCASPWGHRGRAPL
jgi:hypothetical protein